MKVLLADDHALFRAGIASLLRAAGHEVVGEAGNGIEALERTRELHPELVLMDITMPRCGGLEATRLIKAEMPEVKILAVEEFEASDKDDAAIAALKSSTIEPATSFKRRISSGASGRYLLNPRSTANPSRRATTG